MISQVRLLKWMVVFLALFAVLTATVPTSAQDGGTTCPQPTKCQIAQQGMALLQKYNVPPELANGLLPYLSKGDLDGAGSFLAQAGVPQETIKSLAQEAAPLIQQGLSTGAIQQLATDTALNTFPRGTISEEEQGKILQMVGDDGLASFLASRGIASDQVSGIVAKLEEAQAMGFDAGSLDEYMRIQGVAKALDAANLPADQREAFLDVYITEGREGFKAALNEAGLDGAAVNQQAATFIYDEYNALGFKDEEATAFQVKAFLDNAQELAGDPDALAEYVNRRGIFGDDKAAENQAFIDAVLSGDPDAIRSTLSSDPWFAQNADLIDRFAEGVEMDAPGVDMEDMLGDPAFWDEYLYIDALSEALLEAGVPEDELGDYLAGYAEDEDIFELLAAGGYDIDEDAFEASVDDAYESAFMDAGFSDDDINAFWEDIDDDADDSDDDGGDAGDSDDDSDDDGGDAGDSDDGDSGE